MINISKAVTLRIQELLKEQNLTQYRLEQITGLSHDTLKSIMKGKAKGVNLKTVIIIADGFNITTSEFLNSKLFDYDNLNID